MAAPKKPKKPAAAKVEEGGASRFELDGKTLEFDIDTLTFGEVEFVEEYFGVPLDLVVWESGRGSLIAAYLAMKRQDDSVTLDKLRELEIRTLKQVGDGEGSDRPTE